MEIVIPLHGLTRGGQEFEFSLGDDFLERFSRDLIQGLDARADLVAEQKGGWIEIHCKVVGEAKVECDRCLEELSLIHI